MLAFETMLIVDRVIPSLKSCQGSRAASVKSGYGMPSLGILANPPKMTEKITIVKSGWITAQATPRPVCLYRIFTSRQTKK